MSKLVSCWFWMGLHAIIFPAAFIFSLPNTKICLKPGVNKNNANNFFGRNKIQKMENIGKMQKQHMNTHEHPWTPMNSHEFPWTPMNSWVSFISSKHPKKTCILCRCFLFSKLFTYLFNYFVIFQINLCAFTILILPFSSLIFFM